MKTPSDVLVGFVKQASSGCRNLHFMNLLLYELSNFCNALTNCTPLVLGKYAKFLFSYPYH